MDENSSQSPAEEQRCSFCQRSRKEVTFLLAGGGNTAALICDRCLAHGYQHFNLRLSANTKLNKDQHTGNATLMGVESVPLPTPQNLKAHLDQYVIGQERAKKALSVAVYSHYRRIQLSQDNALFEDEFGIGKSNILFIGPTGCGKTLLAQILSKKLDVPFIIADATTLTETGYVGDDVESILHRLLQTCDFDVARAERGIIFLDEMDKISRKSESLSITRDVSGEGVQQALLKLIEGTTASVPPQGGRKHPQKQCLQLNTHNILFICSGAFEGLEKVIEKRCDHSGIGFSAPIKSSSVLKQQKGFQQVEPEDLLHYGLIPELIGRLPLVVTLDSLDNEALVRILTEPKNALVKQYQALFKMENVQLDFTPEALQAIAREAIAHRTGARGLRAIIDSLLLDTMFDLPSISAEVTRVEITEAVVKKISPPIYYPPATSIKSVAAS